MRGERVEGEGGEEKGVIYEGTKGSVHGNNKGVLIWGAERGNIERKAREEGGWVDLVHLWSRNNRRRQRKKKGWSKKVCA